ncbi:FAD:protein FMN transferase [Falsiruegeria litorea]|uniref:FAD:protein FMN transferase n=1 Tax=Falsiruegeria litorea TaxID=1280831 RepID=UPI001BFD17E7|nr:FAD:protein FMN transferase [Falsiruegeria litorea]MBT8169283.1 FAD:protein FMN transferase [Falsiruegeria litorea]
MTTLSRRRFLTISASTLAVPAFAMDAPIASWSGTAMGASASMQLQGVTPEVAAPIFAGVEQELGRLENIFSLYRPDSELSRLNQTGHLKNPAPELLEVLSLCDALHHSSGGAFDPSIQPYWQALARRAPEPELVQARGLIGWENVRFDPRSVRFEKGPGMALTLNGVAQGAVTDRIAALLRAQGLQDVMVNMGEISARGNRRGAGGWTAGIATPEGRVVHRVTLQDRAIATSSPRGMMINPDLGVGHILDALGQAPQRGLVSVTAPTAALADGLSTALCLLDDQAAELALRAHPTAELVYSA